MDEFMMNVFGEIAFWPDGHVCINGGWEVETILVTITTALKIYDCYEVLIDTLL